MSQQPPFYLALEKQMAALATAHRLNEEVDRYVAEALERAAPFYVSRPITQLLSAAVETVPPVTLAEQMVPTYSGFVYFEAPLPLPALPVEADMPRGFVPGGGPLAAFTWYPVDATELHDPHGEAIPFEAGMSLQLVFLREDATFLHAVAAVPWKLGTTQNVQRDGRKIAVDPAFDDQDDVVWTEAAHARMDREMDYVAAFFSFLEQKLIRHAPARVPRSTRHRIERNQWQVEPVVNVITFRGVDYVRPEGGGDSSPIEWNCQWLVRGHWRQQFYPSEDRHRAIWINPYVKGPEDQPLKKPKVDLFAVVR